MLCLSDRIVDRPGTDPSYTAIVRQPPEGANSPAARYAQPATAI
jgi:hypothetical protein